MALDLESTSSQYAHLATPAFTDQPFSISCWIIPENDVAEEVVAGLFDSGTTNHFHRMQVATGNQLNAASAAGGTTNVAPTTGTVAFGGTAWYHCFTSFGPTTGVDRVVSLNGSTFVTSTTNRAATGLDRFVIGANYNGGTPAGFFDGLVALVAVWNAQLTQAEVVALSVGAHPRMIRPENLLHFWPLFNDGVDYARGSRGTLTLEASPSFVQKMPPIAPFPFEAAQVFTFAAPPPYVEIPLVMARR